MTPRTILLTLALLCAGAPLAARAQTSTTAPNSTRREQAIERRDAQRARREARAALTPDQRRAARAERQARIAAMPPEQQEYMRDLRSYQQGLRLRSRELQAQVTAGTISRDAMAHELKTYRDANRPSRPAGMPERTRKP
jgi:hypothetical protein